MVCENKKYKIGTKELIIFVFFAGKRRLDCKKKQIQRIRLRNGEDGVLMFQERWIPMENTYFHSFRIQEKCDLYFKT